MVNEKIVNLKKMLLEAYDYYEKNFDAYDKDTFSFAENDDLTNAMFGFLDFHRDTVENNLDLASRMVWNEENEEWIQEDK